MEKSYKEYKDLCVQRERDFDNYCEEVDKHASELKQNEFGKMYEGIQKEFDNMTDEEFEIFVTVFKRDREVSKPLKKMVEGISIIRSINKKGDEAILNLLELMISMM